MSKIDNLLAEEGAAAENYQMPEELPDHVQVSRRNMGRPSVVSVRLSSHEHHELQRAADDAGLPISTLIRLWALERLQTESDGNQGSIAARLTRLEQEVFRDPA